MIIIVIILTIVILVIVIVNSHNNNDNDINTNNSKNQVMNTGMAIHCIPPQLFRYDLACHRGELSAARERGCM